MYERSDKRRIYEIIEMYLSGTIDEPIFCDEFHCSHNVELDYDALTKDEKAAFLELSDVAGRFSEFETDHRNYPRVYYTKEELKQKIIETKEKLKK